MNPILYFIYYLLKSLVRLCFWIYFRKRTFINKHHLQFERPCILVSNHPNTMLDPLLSAVQVNKKEVFFLANYSLFKTSFQNWFFNTFYCIPIQRREDMKGKPLQNEDNFRRARVHLMGGGCLYIAVEGSSYLERHLRELKTGTARIAFNTEELNNFNANLIIQPVGLTYSAPTKFRSKVLINAGTPIEVKDFQALYNKDAFTAVNALTEKIAQRIRSVMIDTRSPEEDRLVQQLEAITQTENPANESAHFHRTRQMIKLLRQWEKKAPLKFENFKKDVLKYHVLLKAWKLRDKEIVQSDFNEQTVRLLLGLPVFIWGYVNNFLPAFLCKKMVDWMDLYVGYNSTVKILTGLLAFPIFYLLQMAFIYYLTNSLAAFFYLISLPLTGLFASRWVRWASAWMRKYRWQQCQKKAPQKIAQVLKLRSSVARHLHKIVPDYAPSDLHNVLR